jgi:hypothetical protein
VVVEVGAAVAHVEPGQPVVPDPTMTTSAPGCSARLDDYGAALEALRDPHCSRPSSLQEMARDA